MSNQIGIRNLTTTEITSIIPKLNQEFVYSKKRLLPVQVRFPELFNAKNHDNLFGLFVAGSLASFVAVKRVTIVNDGQEIEAFFVGAVFTDDAHRGKGYSSKLMTYVQEHFLSLGVNLGILWTGINSFYEKLGWVTADNGVFVTCNSPTENMKSYYDAKIVELDDHLLNQVDVLRTKQENTYIKRDKDGEWYGYRTVYSPGEKLLRLVSFDVEGRVTGYLLGAANQTDCFVYEINAICQRVDVRKSFIDYLHNNFAYDSLKVNLSEKDDLIEVLNKSYEEVVIKKTSIQMFFCCDNSLGCIAKDFYVSFSDRI